MKKVLIAAAFLSGVASLAQSTDVALDPIRTKI